MFAFSRIAKFISLTALTALFSLPASAAERVSDFSLVDADGRFFQLSRHANMDAVVLLSYNKDSRDARRAVSDLEDLAEDFADQQVEFLLINSTDLAEKAVLLEEAADRDIEFRILVDDTQLVSQELGLSRAAEAVVINPESREVVFRGALDSRQAEGSRGERNDAAYVADALTAMLAGNEVPSNSIASKGELIEYPAFDNISYADDIAPILEERCVTCHTEGGIAPFAMSNHQMVRGWSPMIRETLITKRMPPGQIDREYVNEFHDINHITIEETQKLVSWINSGSNKSGDADPLAKVAVTPPKWSGGEPDMIIQIPEQQIPATGVQDYRNLMIPLELEEDIWVKAIEFEAGDPTVLHHIIAFSYGPNGVNEFEILNQGIGLGAYAPGNELNLYPEGAGYPLQKGGGLMLQMHYTTSGKEAIDASEIGLYLWDEKPEKAILGGSASDLDIDIAPFSREEMVATAKFRKDSYLTMVGPHMHYRGYDANFKLKYPDGRIEEVLNVPNYQFNWQKTYDFVEPKFLPAGTEMIFRGTFDNTEMNPFNPDASQTLSWGEQTWQEMFFGFFRYVEADNSGE
ncbi:MAG: redoxin domain-containing protein [Pseudohongiellaceae bacterium]|jgi:peroxiredoxin